MEHYKPFFDGLSLEAETPSPRNCGVFCISSNNNCC